MRVLHLPLNVGSQMSTYVRALRQAGVEARGLVVPEGVISDNQGLEVLEVESLRRHPIRGVTSRLAAWRKLREAFQWADVIHWRYGIATVVNDGSHWVKYAARLGKGRLVDFCGSDVRINETACADNPYFREVVERGENRPNQGSREASLATQRLFARHGFECILRRFELVQYLDKACFPSPYLVKSPTMLSDYEPQYPDPANRRPMVVHCPSHKGLKGTSAVMAAVEKLKKTHDFEFQLVHGVPHAQAMEMVRRCDIMLDQFVLWEYANAASEAMAYGKPVLCRIHPSLVPLYPPDLPIVNANPDDLADRLGSLLADGRRRHELGRASRAYMEKYHDAHALARQMIGIYEEVLRKARP